MSSAEVTNNLDPDQAWQNIGPDLGPSYLTLMEFLKDIFEKVDSLKNQQMTKKAWKFTQKAEFKWVTCFL